MFLDFTSTSKAFSKQALHYDAEDQSNIILQDLRKQIYAHAENLLSHTSRILELNAGTGIDALHFIQQGHHVHATDLSTGMIEQLNKKRLRANGQLSVQQISFTEIEAVKENNFDLVFSNFGGLNCSPDLTSVCQAMTSKLRPGGYALLIIMPPVCPWEILGILKGNAKALRRLKNNGTMAHLEGEYFKTWYYSLSRIKKSMGNRFQFINSQGIASLSPPPYAKSFAVDHPKFYSRLRSLDAKVRNHFPFNRWGDHLMVTFKLKG